MAKGIPQNGINRGWLKKGQKPWNYGLKGYLSGRTMTRDTKIKISEANRKKHHDNLTPIKNLIRSQFLYREWRVKIYERDDFTCQACMEKSVSGKRKRLHAHHIKHFSEIIRQFNIKTIDDAQSCGELWDTDNGITLCDECHRLAHYTGNGKIRLNGEDIVWQKETETKTEKKT